VCDLFLALYQDLFDYIKYEYEYVILQASEICLLPLATLRARRAVSIAMGYGMHGWGSITSRGKRLFSSPRHPDQLWGSSIVLSNGYWRLFPGVREAWHEADHSPTSHAKAKNGRAMPPLSHVFIVWCLTEHRENFTLFLLLAMPN
jgi:hypothetical protein